MRFKALTLAPVLLALQGPIPVQGAETGDLDGDGNLTIRDIALLSDSEKDPTIEFAPGSFEAFAEFPPYITHWDPSFYRAAYVTASMYEEVLRRTLGGPYPAYSFLHEPTTWLKDVPQDPLPSDSRATLSLLGAEVVGRDRVAVSLVLDLKAPVRSFSIAVQSPEGMLRVPWIYAEEWKHPALYSWRPIAWGFLLEALKGNHEDGDIVVNVPPVGYLMSGGDYVITYGLRSPSYELPIEPGVYRIVAEGRLPKDTPAGTYPLVVLEGSQIHFQDGVVARPTVVENGPLVVPEAVTIGWDEGLPPLRFDLETQRVLGAVEFRFADNAGRPVPQGIPVARGKPGEVVRFRVQVRTETPLNLLSFQFQWPPESLICTGEDRTLLEMEGEPIYENAVGVNQCTHWAGWSQMSFHCGSNWVSRVHPTSYTTFPTRALEYFKPLGVWLDLWEAVMQIPMEAPLAIIPLEFLPYVLDSWETLPRAEFVPYGVKYYPEGVQPPGVTRDQWKYDVRLENSFVEVIGGANPPEPPDLGIKLKLGEAQVEPGGLAEIQVLASANSPLWFLWLVLETNPADFSIEAVKTKAYIKDTGETRWVTVLRGESATTVDGACSNEACFGTPHSVSYMQSDNGHTVIHWGDIGAGFPFPGPEPIEVARLVVRAAERPPGSVIELRSGTTTVEYDEIHELGVQSGGRAMNPVPGVPLSPASVFIPGILRISTAPTFMRGDTNADERIDLTDAISILSYLFVGAKEPGCLDSADADDTGRVDLADAIYLLQWLFVGSGQAPPAPQQCGKDPSLDEIPCASPQCISR